MFDTNKDRNDLILSQFKCKILQQMQKNLAKKQDSGEYLQQQLKGFNTVTNQ